MRHKWGYSISSHIFIDLFAPRRVMLSTLHLAALRLTFPKSTREQDAYFYGLVVSSPTDLDRATKLECSYSSITNPYFKNAQRCEKNGLCVRQLVALLPQLVRS